MPISEFFFDTKPKFVPLNKGQKRTTQLLSLGAVKLHFLLDIQKFSTKILIVSLVSIFIGFYNFFILERTGLYSLGISSVFQSIARCVSYFLKKGNYVASAKAVHTILFWGMSLIMNLPLAVLGFRKIGKKFTILTLVNICVSSVTSMMLASLPASWGLKNFHIFSDPRTFNTGLINEGIYILQWNYITNFQVTGSGANIISFAMNDNSRVILIFLYGVVFGLLNTFAAIFIYSLGGSTGGMDWLIYYYVKQKRKRINNIYFYMSLILTFIAYVVGTYVPYVDYMLFNKTPNASSVGLDGVSIVTDNNLNNKQHSVISSLLGPMFIATVIAALVRKIMYYFFYPSFQMVTVKIYTHKPIELRRNLIQSEFPQSFTINLAIGGYKLRSQSVFEVTCFVLDFKFLKELARSVDSSCLIIASPVRSLTGRFVVQDNIN